MDEAGTNLQDSVGKEVSDIQFEEVFNLDQIQATLTQSLQDETFDINAGSDQENPEVQDQIEFEEAPKVDDKFDIASNIPDFGPPSVEADLNSKKYVVYVDSDNINYMEALSIKERRDVVNKILREHNRASIKEKETARRKKFIKHIIFACVTFIIIFPIMFFIVNTSMMATMKNYQLAKDNFSKLYKQQGKVQQLPSGAE